MEVRRHRTRLLRELGERKNHEFRRRMLGKTLPAVTLEQRGLALTTNFLNVELASDRGPNQMVDLTIGSVSERGLREASLLPIL